VFYPAVVLPARVAAVPIDDRSDEELMRAAASDSHAAFAVLVARYLGPLTSYCSKLTAADRAGEELAQEVLLAVWRLRRDYRPDARFRVFVFTIASNRCRNHARSWRRKLRWLGFQGDGDELADIASSSAGQLDEVLARERQRGVRSALARLPAQARDVLLLRFEQDLAYAEIAQITGSAEGTVRSKVFHALRKLQSLLEEVDVP